VDPYRADAGAEVLEAPVRQGLLRLEVAPRHATLVVGEQHVVVAEEFVTLTDLHRKKPRKRSFGLGSRGGLGGRRLVMARSVPLEELALWYEPRPGVVRRIFGIQPLELVDDAALRAWRALDLLAGRLREIVRPHADGVLRAIELGSGADRVLHLDYGNRHVLYQRPLFREDPRRTLEVQADGTVLIPRRRKDLQVTCTSRFGITVIGDYLRFADPTGLDLAQVAFPWITPEDRGELARRIADLIQPP
jgi:hypothetical protein